MGRSRSPLRRRLATTQRFIKDEVMRMHELLNTQVVDNTDTNTREVGADVLESIVRQQALVADFKS